MTFPVVLYVLFALLAAGGLYAIGSYFRGRSLGVKLAVGALAFFGLLALGMAWLLSSFGG